MNIIEILSYHEKLTDLIYFEFNIEDLERKNRFYSSVAVDDCRKIAYFKAGDVADAWDPENRRSNCIMTKAGKFFKHINPDATDSQIQKIVSKWYAIINCLDDNFKFELSEDVVKWYHDENYCGGGGSLGSSCMRYASCQDFISFYENYDVKILILKKDDKIKGRALVWNNVYFSDRGERLTFMDRVYVHNNNDVELFLDYAKNQDWIYKELQSMSEKARFENSRGSFIDTIHVEPISSVYVYDYQVPYFDTLSYADEDGHLCNIEKNEYRITLESTNGTVEGGFVCDVCRDTLHEEDIFSADHDDYMYCENCFNERYTYCADCGEIVNRDDTTYIENHGDICEGCRDHDYIQCHECNDYFYTDDVKETIDNGYLCDSCITQYYYEQCDDCGLYEKQKYCSTIKGENYCGNCADLIEDALYVAKI